MPFRRPEIIRPPSEWKSYFLPLTGGCSNNTCTFCSYYGTRLQIRELEDVKREIDTLALFKGKGVYLPGTPDLVYAVGQGWDGKRIFLQDGDALVYPLPKLVSILQYIGEKLPSVERIATYATSQDILRIETVDLIKLRELNLSIFYMGLESGDDKILTRIGKGVNSGQIIRAGLKAKEAGILTSVTVILGLGGIKGSEQHVLETSMVLSDIDPDYAGALTLIMVPGTPLYEDRQQGNFSLLSPFQSLKELSAIIKYARFTNCFFSSMHASNYFNVRGILPEDETRMIKELENVIRQEDASSLRPETLRGL